MSSTNDKANKGRKPSATRRELIRKTIAITRVYVSMKIVESFTGPANADGQMLPYNDDFPYKRI